MSKQVPPHNADRRPAQVVDVTLRIRPPRIQEYARAWADRRCHANAAGGRSAAVGYHLTRHFKLARAYARVPEFTADQGSPEFASIELLLIGQLSVGEGVRPGVSAGRPIAHLHPKTPAQCRLSAEGAVEERALLGSLGCQAGAGAECSVRRRPMKCLLNIDRGE